MQLDPRLPLLSLLAFVGCAVPMPEGAGSASVAAFTGALGADDVADVVLRVSGEGIEPDISQVLIRGQSGQFNGRIEGIPAGAARSFDAVARDQNGVALYLGGVVGVPVVAGEEVAVHLLLQQAQPPLPFDNGVPHFTSIVASSLAVGAGESIGLWAAAEDLDGDELAYQWVADGGLFVDPGAAATRWTAPADPGPHGIVVSVSDPRGAVAKAAFVVDVVDVSEAPDSGVAVLAVEVNTAPEIAGLRVEPSQIDVGERVELQPDGADPDGDVLSLSWASDCEGGFSTEGGATVFELAARPASGWCVLEAMFDDGRGGRNRAAVTLAAGPAVLVGTSADAMAVAQLVISEVMPNPAVVADGQGEWFELYNAGVGDFDLHGCVIGDAGGASHTIASAVMVAPGGYALLANDAAAVPGVDYVYAGVGLNNSNESLTLRCDDAVVDTVAWSTSRAGTSLSLDPGSLDAMTNDDPAHWCDTPDADVYGLGDRGTPGAINSPCG